MNVSEALTDPRIKDVVQTLMASVRQREKATVHLPVLLSRWTRLSDETWIRLAINHKGFRYIYLNLRRFVVSSGPVEPGYLTWWSNGGGGGPETGEAGKAAADALALEWGYALTLEDARVQLPDGSIVAPNFPIAELQLPR